MVLRLFFPKEKKSVDISIKDAKKSLVIIKRRPLGESTVNFLNFNINENLFEINSSQFPYYDSTEFEGIVNELLELNSFFPLLLAESSKSKGNVENYITDIQNTLTKYINLALTDAQYYNSDFFQYLIERNLFNTHKNNYTRIKQKIAFNPDVNCLWNINNNDNYLSFTESERFKAGITMIEEIKAAYFEKNTIISGICYDIDNLMDAYVIELSELFKRGMIIKKCKNCGKYFIPLRSDALYCSNISPQEKLKTCKEYGAYEQYKQNVKSDEVKKLYRNIYMKKQMASKRNPDIEKYKLDFEEFKMTSKQWKDEIKLGLKSESDFLFWLKNIK